MEKKYDAESLKKELDQFENSLILTYQMLDQTLSEIQEPIFENTPSLVRIKSSIQRELGSAYEKLSKTFTDINTIIKSFYIDTEIFIEDDHLKNIEKHKNLLYSTTQIIKSKLEDDRTKIQTIRIDGKDDLEVTLIEFTKNHKSSFSTLTKSLKEINQTLKSAYNEYQIIISNEFRSTLNKEIEIINKNFSHERLNILSNLKNDINHLNDILSLEKNNISTQIKNSNSEISNLKNGLKSLEKSSFELTKEINEYSNKVNELVGLESNNLKTKLNEYFEQFKSDYDKKINEINDSYEAAKKNYQNFSALAERAGIYGLTQNYAKKAKEEKLEYQNYRRYTTFSILAAIGTTVTVILIPIIEHWGLPINMDSNYYYTLMARLTISIMFFVLALYLSKQASKHYECYQENHRTYLQLAALEPFINRMSDEEQLNIRKSLIPIYFNQHKEGKFSSKEDEVKLPQITSHLKNLRQLGKINKNTQP